MALYKITYTLIQTKTEFVRADTREDAFRQSDLIDWSVGHPDTEEEEIEVYRVDDDE